MYMSFEDLNRGAKTMYNGKVEGEMDKTTNSTNGQKLSLDHASKKGCRKRWLMNWIKPSQVSS